MRASSRYQLASTALLALGFILGGVAVYRKSREEEGYEPKTLGDGEIDITPRKPGALPGKVPNAQRRRPAPGSAAALNLPPNVVPYDVKTIEQRVSLIADLMRKGAKDGKVRERAIEIVSRKCDALGNVVPHGTPGATKYCVPEKSCIAEVQAIFNAVRNPASPNAIRYVRDSVLADIFAGADRTLFKLHGGDCDDYAVTCGALLLAIGHPVRIRVIRTVDKPSWSHVYLLTPRDFDNPKAPWISFDASMAKPLGWEAPGASECARTGKAAGITAAVKDFEVVRPQDLM